MNMRQTGVVAGASLAAVAGLAAVLSSAGLLDTDDAAKAGSSALSLYGVAHVVHTGADGTVLDTQSVHNRLLDEGESYVLKQVFRNGESDADTMQIGAVCLSAYQPDLSTNTPGVPENSDRESRTDFIAGHNNAYQDHPDNLITAANTRECMTDTDVEFTGQVASVGPLTFTANTSSGSSNWVPGQTVAAIGVCQADTGGASVGDCAGTLFAAVDISNVTLNNEETLTVTYTFDMSGEGT